MGSFETLIVFSHQIKLNDKRKCYCNYFDRDFGGNGNFIFTGENFFKIMMGFLLGSVPNKSVPLRLENMICISRKCL